MKEKSHSFKTLLLLNISPQMTPKLVVAVYIYEVLNYLSYNDNRILHTGPVEYWQIIWEKTYECGDCNLTVAVKQNTPLSLHVPSGLSETVREAKNTDLLITSWFKSIDNLNQSPVGHDQAHQAAAGAVLASYVEEGETRFHCFFVSFAKQQLRGDIKSGRVNVGILTAEAVFCFRLLMILIVLSYQLKET